MIDKKEQLKPKAKELTSRDLDKEVSEEQRIPWAEFKTLRNDITNRKIYEETNFKSSKISEDLDSPKSGPGTL